MNTLAALLLFGTPTAPTPSLRDLIIEATPDFVLKANGYVEGLTSAFRDAVPAVLFT